VCPALAASWFGLAPAAAQRLCRVPQIVRAKGDEAGGRDGRRPEPLAPQPCSYRAAVRTDEDVAVRIGLTVCRHVGHEMFGHLTGNRHGAATGARLGRPVDQLTAYLHRLLHDPHRRVERIDPVAAQSREFR
jgi:hypothetical protein